MEQEAAVRAGVLIGGASRRMGTPKALLEIEGLKIEAVAGPLFREDIAFKLEEIGEIEILKLRKHAKRKLAEKFDIRKFHDVVLGAGPLPLTILKKRVDAWIERTAPADG